MTAEKKKRKSFWSKAEAAGQAMEVGMRTLLGLIFTAAFGTFGFWLGSQLHAGVGIIVSLLLLPIGFLLGFFWVEVKFLIRLILGSILD